MTFRIEALMGRIAIAGSLFAVGCMAEEKDTTSGLESDLDLNASDGQTDDLAAMGGTAAGGSFTVVPLTANKPGVAPNVDPALVNAWGIVPFERMFWIADNGTGKLSILDGQGKPSPKSGDIDLGEPITGIVATGVSAREKTLFQMPKCHEPALLITVSESGKLIGVNPSTAGRFEVVYESKSGAIYKGVTILQRTHNKGGPLILAADFHNARVDVFNAKFEPINAPSFVASGVDAGFAPFNVMASGDGVYITYAQQDADAEDDVPGDGYVVSYRSNGKQLRLAHGGGLSAPWGMVMARNFGSIRSALLVGNFGDGHVNVLDPTTLKIRGQLSGQNGQPIAIDGLWGLSFGDDVRRARRGALYFAAGPDDETNGLFGVIVPGRRCDDGGCKADM